MTGPGLGWLVGGHCLFSASVGWPGCLGPSSIMIAGNAQSRGRGPPAFAGRIASRTRPRGDRGEGAIGPDGRGQQVHSDWRPERGSTRRRTPDRSRDARASRSHQRRSALVVRARPNPLRTRQNNKGPVRSTVSQGAEHERSPHRDRVRGLEREWSAPRLGGASAPCLPGPSGGVCREMRGRSEAQDSSVSIRKLLAGSIGGFHLHPAECQPVSYLRAGTLVSRFASCSRVPSAGFTCTPPNANQSVTCRPGL